MGEAQDRRAIRVHLEALRAVNEEFGDLAQTFDISLRARRRVSRTILGYVEAMHMLASYLQGDPTFPTDPTLITRSHIECFFADLAERTNPRTQRPMAATTLINRYRSLHAFFEWLVKTDELERSPMDGVDPPKAQKKPPPAISEANIARLFATCQGKDFRDRRDLAMLTLLLDTGLRRMELANLSLSDIDWERQTLRVLGKGDKVRDVSFGNQSALALRAYQRIRKSHPRATSDHLWIGRSGPILSDAVLRIVKRRAKEAGLQHIWTHLFRHSWAHYFLDAGGREGDLKILGGWSSDSMVRYYGSGEAANRAQKAHREYSPADRLLANKKKGDK